jgi:TusA-related sulfurtransferase
MESVMTGNGETTQTAETAIDIPLPTTQELLGSASSGDDKGGGWCAVFDSLIPAIKAELKDLEPSQVLLVRTNAPSARMDVPAWCALTGNVLQATSVDEGGVIHFFIRKGSKRR